MIGLPKAECHFEMLDDRRESRLGEAELCPEGPGIVQTQRSSSSACLWVWCSGSALSYIDRPLSASSVPLSMPGRSWLEFPGVDGVYR